MLISGCFVLGRNFIPKTQYFQQQYSGQSGPVCDDDKQSRVLGSESLSRSKDIQTETQTDILEQTTD